MRCKTVECTNLTRNPNRTECWTRFQKCRKCCLDQGLIEHKGKGGYRTKKIGNGDLKISYNCMRGIHANEGRYYECKGRNCICKCHDVKGECLVEKQIKELL